MKLYPATDTLARRIHNVAVGGVVVLIEPVTPQPFECEDRDNYGSPCGAITLTYAKTFRLGGGCNHLPLEKQLKIQDGDILGIKESGALGTDAKGEPRYFYKADNPDVAICNKPGAVANLTVWKDGRIREGIINRWESARRQGNWVRHWLKIQSVTVKRLSEVTEEEAHALIVGVVEGFGYDTWGEKNYTRQDGKRIPTYTYPGLFQQAKSYFLKDWDATHGKTPGMDVASDPWVFVASAVKREKGGE